MTIAKTTIIMIMDEMIFLVFLLNFIMLPLLAAHPIQRMVYAVATSYKKSSLGSDDSENASHSP